MNTRKKIIEVSLDIMSKKGYNAMSIRDVCKIVGIKESTIYYHFKNKEDILNNIIAKFEMINSQMTSLFDNVDYNMITADTLKEVTLGYVNYYLLDDFIVKFAKTLLILQSDNLAANSLYHKYFIELPVDFQKQIFTQLINNGVIRQMDAEFAANSYYSYIFFQYNKCILSHNIDNVLWEEFIDNIEEFINDFIKIYGA